MVTSKILINPQKNNIDPAIMCKSILHTHTHNRLVNHNLIPTGTHKNAKHLLKERMDNKKDLCKYIKYIFIYLNTNPIFIHLPLA